ncbi:hypothetical protein B0H17DRAFT_1179470 [Mycena rosella]|uniref:Uncharacterized protein n=1 Tax=Mycena rosella TaxID=1033263 RepID=A0AAD7DKI4_MYCRO|nr:hypothetical protein B0H17DRAFT_1179470 [Mycena rosella]
MKSIDMARKPNSSARSPCQVPARADHGAQFKLASPTKINKNLFRQCRVNDLPTFNCRNNTNRQRTIHIRVQALHDRNKVTEFAGGHTHIHSCTEDVCGLRNLDETVLLLVGKYPGGKAPAGVSEECKVGLDVVEGAAKISDESPNENMKTSQLYSLERVPVIGRYPVHRKRTVHDGRRHGARMVRELDGGSTIAFDTLACPVRSMDKFRVRWSYLRRLAYQRCDSNHGFQEIEHRRLTNGAHRTGAQENELQTRVSSPPRRSAYLGASPKRLCGSPSKPPSPPSPHWETPWYKRWEILIELVRLDTERERVQRAPAPLAVRPPRFFIGEDDDEGEGDESWGEERWDEVLNEDEVMIVSNELFACLLRAWVCCSSNANAVTVPAAVAESDRQGNRRDTGGDQEGGEGAWVFSGITYQKGSPARKSAAVWICAPIVRLAAELIRRPLQRLISSPVFRRLPVSNSHKRRRS